MTEEFEIPVGDDAVFVDATAQVDELLADPVVRDLVESGREARAEMNRA